MRFLSVLGLVAILTATAADEVTPKRKLFSSGSWTLYTMPTHVATDTAMGFISVDFPFCTAQTGSDQKEVFRVIYFFEGIIIVQVGSHQWDYRRRYGKLSFRVANLELTFWNARYAESYVEQYNKEQDAGAIEVTFDVMAGSGASSIEVLDYKGRIIARFPTAGMGRVLRRAKQCAEKY